MYKIFVPGNHDKIFEQMPRLAREELGEDEMTKVLITEGWTCPFTGLKYWGEPRTPEHGDEWAFNEARNGERLELYFDQIPEDTNILITHGPAWGTLDRTKKKGDHLGCELLAKRLRSLKDLRLHIFGHVHGGYGQVLFDGTRYINAAICREKYAKEDCKLNEPFVVEV